MVDLHQHTNLSDGTDDIFQLLQKNKDLGIKILAITDHDNIESAKLVSKLKNTNYGMQYINGIEFSTSHNGESIHILAYGYDIDDPIVKSLVENARLLRLKRINKRLEILKSEFNISLNESNLEKIKNSSNPNKPMIANMLVEQGYGLNITDVIKKYLYHKLPSEKLTTEETIVQLKKSSAVSVYAHALGGVGEKRVERATFEKRLAEFINFGLDGLECYYSLYNEEEQSYLLGKARENNLIISGGSDYHGKNKSVHIGELSSYGFLPATEKLTVLTKVKSINI